MFFGLKGIGGLGVIARFASYDIKRLELSRYYYADESIISYVLNSEVGLVV